MKKLTVLFIVFGVLLPAFAKPKPKTKAYSAPCARVWEAAKIAVQEHYDVLSLDDNKQAGSFTTGSVWTGVRPIAFSLNGEPDTCTVSVTGHFSGLIHNDKGDFFRRIEEALTLVKDRPATSAVKQPPKAVPEQKSTADNSPTVAIPAPQGKSEVHLDSFSERTKE